MCVRIRYGEGQQGRLDGHENELKSATDRGDGGVRRQWFAKFNFETLKRS